MKVNKALISIYIIVLGFMLFFIFQTPTFSSDESYFHIRYTNNILEGKSLFYDDLSYGGRPILHLPLFDFILIIFSMLPFYLKIIPAIFISLTVIFSYFISREIVDNKTINLLVALLIGFTPIIISETLNSISVYSLIIPLILLSFYCLLKINIHKKYLNGFIILSLFLPLLHPSMFILTFSLIFYIILLETESIKISKLRKEAIIFSIFITFFINFIFFKKAFLLYSLSTIWQTPWGVLGHFLSQINVLESFYQVGILSVILGSIGIFYGALKEKKDAILLLSSLILSTLLLLLLKLITLQIGLIFLSIGLTLISTSTLNKLYLYIKMTKLSKLIKYFTLAIVLLILILAIVPSYFVSRSIIKNSPTIDQINEIQKLKHESSNVVILGSIEEGHMISTLTNRKNVIDTNFLLAPQPEQRFKDVEFIYTTWSEVKALELIKKYDIDFIYLSPKTKKLYNITELSYAKDEACFRKEENVYKILC